MMKKLLYCLLLLTLIIVVGGCSNKEKNDNPLVIGMELAYPPFEMTDPQGSPAGISVDLAVALGDYLHRPIKIENMSFDGLIPSLKTGKIDVILSSMTITEERKKSIDFSDPYLSTGLCLLISKKSSVTGIENLDRPGVKIAVKKGTTGHIYAEKNFTNATIMVFDKENTCVLEVVQGKADAFIYDQMSTLVNWQKNPETTRAALIPFQKEYWGMGLRQEDVELKNQINTFLKKYREKGGFDSLGTKFLADQKKLFAKQNIPFYF